MKKGIIMSGAALVLAFIAIEAAAMVAETTRVVLWRKGESIAGEEFLVVNEEIIDYLATLPRPTEVMKTIRYNCQVKSRLIRPSVNQIGGTGSNPGHVEVRMVYELRDCVAAQE